MKVINHARKPKTTSMTLGTDPMRVFVTRTIEIHIEPGDSIGDIAPLVQKALSLTPKEARQLVGLWFLVGERTSDPKAMQEEWGEIPVPESSRRYTPQRAKIKKTKAR